MTLYTLIGTIIAFLLFIFLIILCFDNKITNSILGENLIKEFLFGETSDDFTQFMNFLLFIMSVIVICSVIVIIYPLIILIGILYIIFLKIKKLNN